MKIGFFGAQGTGKTSLIEAMQKDPYFESFSTIKSSSRAAWAAGRPINKEASRLDQLLITVNRCVADLHGTGNVMSDRTPLDSVAYGLYQETFHWEPDSVEEYYWEATLGLVKSVMPLYDKLYYFPVYWTPPEDGVRLTDPVYQERIDAFVVKSAQRLGLKYETVPNISVPARLGWLKGQLEFDAP